MITFILLFIYGLSMTVNKDRTKLLEGLGNIIVLLSIIGVILLEWVKK